MRIYLCPERAGGVSVNFVIDRSAFLSAGNVPAAFIEQARNEHASAGCARAQPVDILREVAHLVGRIPHGQLQIVLNLARWNFQMNVQQVSIEVEERNGVANRSRGSCVFITLNSLRGPYGLGNADSKKQKEGVRDAHQDFTSTGLALPLSSRIRAGSFS